MCHDWILFCFCNIDHPLCTSFCACRKLIFSILFMNCTVRRFFSFNILENCLWIIIAGYFHSFLVLMHSNLLVNPPPWVYSNLGVAFYSTSLWLSEKDFSLLLVERKFLARTEFLIEPQIDHPFSCLNQRQHETSYIKPLNTHSPPPQF